MTKNEKMLARSERCVCSGCGSRLELHMVIFNQYGGQGIELYCPKCQKIEFGVEAEIYKFAKEFVESYEFNYFPDMAEGEKSTEMNISKIGQILSWFLDRTGVLDEQGLEEKNFDLYRK